MFHSYFKLLSFSFVFVSFSTKTFTFRKFPCAVQISQQNLYMGVCLVEDWGFRPGGVHSHFLPHNLYSFPVHIVGTPGEVSAPGQLSGFHQAAQNSFSGAFQNSNPNFHFYCLPHQHISLSLKTKHQARLSVTGQHFAGIRQ